MVELGLCTARTIILNYLGRFRVLFAPQGRQAAPMAVKIGVDAKFHNFGAGVVVWGPQIPSRGSEVTGD